MKKYICTLDKKQIEILVTCLSEHLEECYIYEDDFTEQQKDALKKAEELIDIFEKLIK